MSTGKVLRILGIAWNPPRPDVCGLSLKIQNRNPNHLCHPIASPVSNIALALVKGILLNRVKTYAITIPETMT